jgi:NTE family protein
MGAEIVIAVNLNGDVVGKHRRNREKEIAEARQQESEAEIELWDRFVTLFKNSVESKKETWLKELLGEKDNMPGMFEILAGSINIMQDRITRSRMAGDPADLMLSPRLAHIGLLEFDQADEVIAEGRESVERMQSALEYAIQNS